MKKKKEREKEKILSVYDYVGNFTTEKYFKKGIKQVIIRVGDTEALLEYPPYSWYAEQNDRTLFDEYIAEKAKNGWKFCASWGYYFFSRPCNEIPKERVEFEFAPKSIKEIAPKTINH